MIRISFLVIKILLLLSLFTVSMVNATTYYVDATNGNDNNDGLSPATAWQTLGKVTSYGFSLGFLPGDEILLKRGEIWREYLIIASSGNPGNRITIGAYGEGTKPIITVMNEVELQWTVYSSNIWKTNDVQDHPQRLLKDGVEVLRAENMTELATNPEIFNWYYDEADSILFLYSVLPPANSKISINTYWSPLSISNRDYVTIRDIEIQGGFTRGLHLTGNYINLINITVGKYSRVGIQTYASSHVLVDSCVIDAHFTLDYSMSGIDASTLRGTTDGLLVLNTHDSEFRNSYFKNWGHASMNIVGVNPGEDVYNNLIHHNFITSPDIAYGGRIATDGKWCYQNEIFNNTIKNISVRNQLNGHNNHFHHNIIDTVRHSPLKSFPTGQGIQLGAYASPVYDNIYENNLIMNTEGAGIGFSGFNTVGDVYKNVFRNNLIFNCGLSDAFKGEENVAILISKDFNICKPCQSHDNIFQNNLTFNESGKTWMVFRDDTIDCKQFNDWNDEDGYVITDNICGNPLFVNVANKDFHLQANSPCIDAGILPKAKFDFDSVSIPFGTAADIGVYEYHIIDFVDVPTIINDIFSLSQNYPNPFNPTTTIEYKIANRQQPVKVEIFNFLGQKIRTLVNEVSVPAGTYSVQWDGTADDGSSVGSGVYLYKIKAGMFTTVKKALLLR